MQAVKSKSPPRTRTQQSSKTTATSDPVFFFKADEEYGVFCQWYLATFTVSKEEMSRLVGHEIDPEDPWTPIYFNCAEQFMMYCKAGLFHDMATQKLILATRDPKEQKRLASKAKGFVAEIWDDIKSQVVVAGNIAKFGQNANLKSLLLDTGERLLVEAASEDRVWGIGFIVRNAMLPQNRQRWGENRLGKALMEARQHLRIQQG
ncbi:NADAR domain-containing protein [Microdochium nivale]|nr:NADAR domain-containing protein [Microdochium nivale]